MIHCGRGGEGEGGRRKAVTHNEAGVDVVRVGDVGGSREDDAGVVICNTPHTSQDTSQRMKQHI